MMSAAALLLSGVSMTAVAQTKGMNANQTAYEPALLQEWTGPYDGVPPWDQVKVSQFPAAFQAAMAASKAEFEAMLAKPEAISFDNTITASEVSGEKIGRLFSIWGVHSSNLSNPEVRKIQAEWEPKLSAFFSELSLDARYFQRVKYLYDQRANLGLDARQMRLLTRASAPAKRDAFAAL
jgi:peptidyl-dipeptidase Dcp